MSVQKYEASITHERFGRIITDVVLEAEHLVEVQSVKWETIKEVIDKMRVLSDVEDASTDDQVYEFLGWCEAYTQRTDDHVEESRLKTSVAISECEPARNEVLGVKAEVQP